MRIKIDGRELLVKKTTRSLVSLQQQTGWPIEEIDEHAKQGYGAALLAFFALANAGFSPVWDELLDRDLGDFEVIKEPGDERQPEGGETPDPQISPADSDPGGDEPARAPAAEEQSV